MDKIRRDFLLYLVITVGTISNTFAQTKGWEFIKNNNYISAEVDFKKTLDADSLNKDALEGLIVLNDIKKNDLDYISYVNRYLRHYLSAETYEAFKHVNLLSFKEVEGKTLPVPMKINKKLKEYRDLREQRNFDESEKLIDHVVQKLDWYMIGPFKNINGFGHIKKYFPESGSVDTSKSYINSEGKDIKWLKPRGLDRYRRLIFSDHLNEGNYSDVFYATAFFTTDIDQALDLRLCRYFPIKIWIDGQLLFDSPEKISSEWDREIISFNLKKGTHKVLLKYTRGVQVEQMDNYKDDSWEESLNKMVDNAFRIVKKYKNDEISFFADYDYGSNIILRFTDKEGEIVKVRNTDITDKFSKNEINVRLKEKMEMASVRSKIDSDPESLFNYYLYVSLAQNYASTKGLEKFYKDKLQTNSNSTYFKVLLSRLYHLNGKREKSYETMKNIDLEKTPVFKVIYKEFTEIDEKNQPEEYLKKLMSLHEISPTNFTIIESILEHYNTTGDVEARKKFVKTIIGKYKVYEGDLKGYLEDDYKPYDHDIENKDDDENKKNYKKKLEKQAAKDIKKRYWVSDYKILIRKYKREKAEDKVLALYDEIIRASFDVFSYRLDKAKYLFNIERYGEAIKELKSILKIKPYEGQIFELIGDIYYDQKKIEEALRCYKLAKKYGNSEGYAYFSQSSDVLRKIEKIAGQKQVKKYFDTPTFLDWMQDKTWQERYKDDESVIVGHTSDILMDDENQINLYSQMLIYINTEAGANSWTEYNFNQLGNIDNIKVVKSDGAVVYPEKNRSYVVFKNLKPGDFIVVEASYEWDGKSELGQNLQFIKRLSFHAPVYYTKLEIGLKPEKHLGLMHHKIKDVHKEYEKEGYKFYKWEYENIPNIVDEENVLDEFDRYANIKISTIESWAEIVEWYQAKTYRKLENNYMIQEILDTLIRPEMTDLEKSTVIYNHITEDINYSFTRLLQSGFVPKNTEHTCSQKIGDCKDVATLMISMLRQQGIEAYYVLVKTNQYFHQKTLPGLFFDHVIAGAVIDGKMEYYDLTTDFYPYYVLNENDIDAWGLVIKDGVDTLTQLPNDYLNKTKNLVKHKVTAVLNLDKSLDIEVNSVHKGMTGGRIREIIHRKPKSDWENEILDYMGKAVFSNLDLLDFDFENSKELTKPLKSRYTFRAEEFSDDVLDIHFFEIPFMTGVEKNLSLLSEERDNTLNLLEVTQIEPTEQEIKIEFPSNFQLKFLPQNVDLKSKFGNYKLEFIKIPNGVLVKKYQDFNLMEIKSGDFSSFKSFYQQILKHDKTKIVLK